MWCNYKQPMVRWFAQKRACARTQGRPSLNININITFHLHPSAIMLLFGRYKFQCSVVSQPLQMLFMTTRSKQYSIQGRPGAA